MAAAARWASAAASVSRATDSPMATALDAICRAFGVDP